MTPTQLRQTFSAALSAMYRAEVPLYGDLLDIVAHINGDGAETRIAAERHGAIRLGTAAELALIARVFAVMGMAPVGYYDLARAGLPVHSTAFRPTTDDGLAAAPFRVFTSLLRLDAVEPDLASRAEAVLSQRAILSDDALRLLERAEADGEVADPDAFIAAVLATFRWRGEASVDLQTYRELKAAHPLIADVVAFPNPHINHLTPRVADIDAAHAEMARRGLPTKDSIEGPPRRDCPVLLRQTAFRALTEDVAFRGEASAHTARFGEIESRGAALTPAGMAVYDACLASGDFTDLPDDWEALRERGLVYWADGPLTYEDFLPVSAAGIFKSNLDAAQAADVSLGNQSEFEAAMGRPVLDLHAWYAERAA